MAETTTANIKGLQETVEHIDEELAWLLARRQRCLALMRKTAAPTVDTMINAWMGTVNDMVTRRALAAARAEGLDEGAARQVWDALGAA